MFKALYFLIFLVGPASFQEKTILVLFTLLVLAWLFRDPKFIDGKTFIVIESLTK